MNIKQQTLPFEKKKNRFQCFPTFLSTSLFAPLFRSLRFSSSYLRHETEMDLLRDRKRGARKGTGERVAKRKVGPRVEERFEESALLFARRTCATVLWVKACFAAAADATTEN